MAELQVHNVSFAYEKEWIVNHVDFTIHPGEFVGMIGPNGSGKSTLIRILDGILKPQQGSVTLNGKDVFTMSRPEIARKISVVPQNGSSQFAFTAAEIVMMGRSPYVGSRLFERKEDHEIVEQAMRETDCLQFSGKLLSQLSGGERQRVLIARAIAQQPEILLLDEPNAHMDINHQIECFDLLQTLNQEKKITVLAVSHELNLAGTYGQRLILLKEGKVYQDGEPTRVLTRESIKEIFNCDTIVDRNPVIPAPRVTLVSHAKPLKH